MEEYRPSVPLRPVLMKGESRHLRRAIVKGVGPHRSTNASQFGQDIVAPKESHPLYECLNRLIPNVPAAIGDAHNVLVPRENHLSNSVF